jgi:hypothetical protein
MMLSPGLRRVAALAAAFGIALQALWPAIAQARPADSVSVPICSVDGTRHEIELPLGRDQSDKTGEHCKLCVLGPDRIAAVESIDFSPFICKSFSDQIPETSAAASRQQSLTLAHPRAPPQAS